MRQERKRRKKASLDTDRTDRISCIYKECISHPLFFFQRKLRRALSSQLPWETRPPCPKVQLLYISSRKCSYWHKVSTSLHPGTAFCFLTDTDWEDAAGKWILPVGIGPHCLKARSIKHTSKQHCQLWWEEDAGKSWGCSFSSSCHCSHESSSSKEECKASNSEVLKRQPLLFSSLKLQHAAESPKYTETFP